MQRKLLFAIFESKTCTFESFWSKFRLSLNHKKINRTVLLIKLKIFKHFSIPSVLKSLKINSMMKKNCIFYHFFIDFVHRFNQFEIHFAQLGVKIKSIDDPLAKNSSKYLISKLFHIIEACKIGKNVIILLVIQ